MQLHLALLDTQKLIQEERDKFLQNKSELDNITSENLFLRSIKSQDLDEIVSFLHHIGISSATVDNYLKGLYYRVQNNIEIPPEELKDIIQKISFENRKIIAISEFASKANFQMYTAEATIDIISYIKEYITNILGIVKNQKPQIRLYKSHIDSCVTKIRPIELNIIVDNLISNSKKAGAKNIDIQFFSPSKQKLEIHFFDDGKGIFPENISKLFDFGYTTTNGSGLGLFHVKKIIDNIGGEISVTTNNGKGTIFILTFFKK